jgi:twitching motility two-component system response regulator PilH
MPIKKILIVDDSATDRQFLLEVLSKQGYQCVTAQNGDEGIAKSKSELPDLILMDIIMPGTDGFKATRSITRDEATKHIPVIPPLTSTIRERAPRRREAPAPRESFGSR